MGVKIKTHPKFLGFPTKPKNPWTKTYLPHPPPPKKKNSMPNFRRLETPKNIFCFITLCRMRSDNFEYARKNPYVNQVTPKNTCQIFPPNKSQNRKFQTPKTPSVHPHHLNPEYPLGENGCHVKV